MTYDIFISYRRSSGVNVARMLEQALKARGYSVFFDYNSLRDGEFNRNIFDAIDGARVFLMLMSHESLDRCVNADDWVGYEIKRALGRGMCIVPVIPSNQDCVIPDALSSEFDPVRAMNPLPVDMGIRFEESVDEIERQFPEELRKWHRRTGDTFSTIDPASELFVGRDAEIGRIHELLSAGRIPVITGAGGCGKSEIIRQYAKRFKIQYPGGMFQIDAEGALDWDAALVNLLGRESGQGVSAGSYLKISKTSGANDGADRQDGCRLIDGCEVAEALGNIATRKGPVLLFVDNAESVRMLLLDAADLLADLRRQTGIDVVVTSRVCDMRIAESDTVCEISLSDLSGEDALDLLLQQHLAENSQDRADAAEVSRLLGGRALFLRRVPALIEDEKGGTYGTVLASLRQNLTGAVDAAVDDEHLPSVLWEMSRVRLAMIPLGSQCIKLAECASFFSPDGFAECILRQLWTDVVTRDCPKHVKRFDRALNILIRHNVISRGRKLRIHRLDRLAVVGDVQNDKGLHRMIGRALSVCGCAADSEWMALSAYPDAFEFIPACFMRDPKFCVALLKTHGEYVGRCRLEYLQGKDLRWAVDRFPDRVPHMDFSLCNANDVAWLLVRFPEKINTVNLRDLPCMDWPLLLSYRPEFSVYCDWDALDGYDWSRLLSRQPKFADHCPLEVLSGENWGTILSQQPALAEMCEFSSFSGHDWVGLLRTCPQFSSSCNWSLLNGGDWVGLLAVRPEFSECCEFSKLTGSDWVYLLTKRPEFGSICDWSKLEDRDPDMALGMFTPTAEIACGWSVLLSSQPGFADMCPWGFSRGVDICYLLRRQPQFARYCDLDAMDLRYWPYVLESQPQLAEYCPWGAFTGRDWTSLLMLVPRFSGCCNWPLLNGADWSCLLSVQPQFAELCDWSSIENWGWLLSEQPQFYDRCEWDRLDGREWCTLLSARPEFSGKCDWGKFCGNDWCSLLSSRPQFSSICRWECLSQEDWEQLLDCQPQFRAQCPFPWRRSKISIDDLFGE